MVETETWTYRELYDETSCLASSLRGIGVTVGDRVAGFLPNVPAAGYCMLAATSIGAVWSSCSPDFGVQGVHDRFCQIEPKVFITTDGYFFKGKRIDISKKVAEIVASMPSIEKVIVINYTTPKNYRLQLPAGVKNAVHYDEFVDHSVPVPTLEFEQLPFDHPVYIMYSSGTTGMPKCIVQGVGVLLNHMKELVLHTDLTRDDRIFYFSTTGNGGAAALAAMLLLLLLLRLLHMLLLLLLLLLLRLLHMLLLLLRMLHQQKSRGNAHSHFRQCTLLRAPPISAVAPLHSMLSVALNSMPPLPSSALLSGWMMWNWLTSSLAVGASIILFDGNPLWPDSGCLWRLAERLKMTIFGTSARYLAAIMGDGERREA
jgi:acyl-coenzyme A synthetase/AMP-(fatty) acid ligase